MNYDIKIDTNKLESELNRIIKERDKLKSLLDNIKKETKDLENYWETKTSDSVFNNFNELYDGFQLQIVDINDDITFLESTIENYKNYEEKANKHIDEKIAL